MIIGIIISSNDTETVWNTFRYGNFAMKEGNEVRVFLTGKGVEAESLDNEKFAVTQQMKEFVSNGGKILACGTCLKVRAFEGTETCPVSTLKDMHELVKESEKILTF